jgi:hypothetical protein
MRPPFKTNSSTLTTRLLEALELMEFGVALMRQNIRRQLPLASECKVEAELRRWLIDQPAQFRPSNSSIP